MPEDDGKWHPFDERNDLLAPPSATPRPLQYSAPLELNTEELSPESFEKLVAQLAQRADGARISYIYGQRGQAQQGIDIIASFEDGRSKSYQVKRYQEFKIGDLESIVEKYISGTRPFGSDCLVVAVSCVIDRTEILDRMYELARQHEIMIDIWDKRAISNKLRPHADLVAVFFGQETAKAFCPFVQFSSGSESATAATDRLSLADAVSRGPYRHLELDGAIEAAEKFAESDPDTSAELYGKVAAKLIDSGYSIHVRPILRARVDALVKSGNVIEAASLAIDLFLNYADTADGSGEIKDALEKVTTADGVEPSCSRSMAALASLADTMSGHEVRIDNLASVFDQMQLQDEAVLPISMHFSEVAISARKMHLVQDRLKFLSEVLENGIADRQPERYLLRLDICLAEACDKWEPLMQRCRRFYGKTSKAWALARRARTRQLTNRSQAALEDYDSAISDAVIYGCNKEASYWLYALRYARYNIAGAGAQRDDLHPMAMHLGSQDSNSTLPGNSNAERLALESIVDGAPLSSLGRLSRWRRTAYIRGDITGEVRATRELGNLLSKNLEVVDGIKHLVWSGSEKEVREAAKLAVEAKISWPARVALGSPRQMDAHFEAAIALADLISDEDVASWLDLAWEYASGSGEVRNTEFHDLKASAINLIDAMKYGCTQEFAERVISLLSPSVPWSPNKYRNTDKSHASLLVFFAQRFPEMRESALSDLLRGLPFSHDFANQALGATGAPLLRENADFAECRLLELEPKSHNVFLGLVFIERPNDEVIDYGKNLYQKFMERPSSTSTVQNIWGGSRDLGFFCEYLQSSDVEKIVEKLISQAFDSREAFQNRRDAIEEIGIFASKLSEDKQKRVLHRILPVAQEYSDARSEDVFLRGTDHPLSFMKVNLPSRTLADAAIKACVFLKLDDQERSLLVAAIIRLLRYATEVDFGLIANALVSLVKAEDSFPVEFLAAHSNPMIQACGAYLWANDRSGSLPVHLGEEFSRSENKVVRMTLAQNIDLVEHSRIVEILDDDPRRSIREEIASRRRE